MYWIVTCSAKEQTMQVGAQTAKQSGSRQSSLREQNPETGDRQTDPVTDNKNDTCTQN